MSHLPVFRHHRYCRHHSRGEPHQSPDALLCTSSRAGPAAAEGRSGLRHPTMPDFGPTSILGREREDFSCLSNYQKPSLAASSSLCKAQLCPSGIRELNRGSRAREKKKSPGYLDIEIKPGHRLVGLLITLCRA